MNKSRKVLLYELMTSDMKKMSYNTTLPEAVPIVANMLILRRCRYSQVWVVTAIVTKLICPRQKTKLERIVL